MPWPLSQDYNEAIQNPQTSFGDPELRRGAAICGPTGIPMPRSGNFADVYEFIGDSGSKWAVKCFTREVSDLQDRYGAISKHLLQAKLRFTVDFEYLPRGIRISGQFYPVLKMKWVDGFLLNEFVRDHLDKPKKLEALSAIWLRMAKGLREANMAHADLQHGNVLLVQGRKEGSLAVKLIDYDGMWVPALANKKSGEVGHPNYQHPQRIEQGTYSAEVDRLPLLAIACALRALTVAGKSLWDRYDNGDNLLFREADLRRPGQSALFKELWNLPDATARDLVGHLTFALAGPLENTPFLADLIADEKLTPPTPTQEMQLTAIQAPVAKVGRLVDSRPVQAAPVPLQATSSKASSPWDNLEDEPIASSQSQVRNRSAAKILLGVAGFVLLTAAVGVGIFMTRKGDEPKNQEINLVQANSADLDKKNATKGGVIALDEKNDADPKQDADPKKETGPDILTGQIRRFEGHTSQVFNVVFSPDGKMALSGGASGDQAILWDLSTGKELHKLEGSMHFVAWAPDGNSVATCGYGAWETKDGKKERPNKLIRFWDVKTGRLLRHFPIGKGALGCAAFSPDWRKLLVGSDDGTYQGGTVVKGRISGGKYVPNHVIRLWDVETGQELRRYEGHNENVNAVVFSPDGRQALSGGVTAGEWVADPMAKSGKNYVAKGVVRLWDVETGKEVRRFEGHPSAVRQLAFSRDGSQFISAGTDGTIRLWETQTGQLLRRIEAHKGQRVASTSVALSPDGAWALSGGGDDTVRMWEMATGKEIHRFDGHTFYVTAVDISSDGRFAISASGDKTVRLWQLPKSGDLSQNARKTSKDANRNIVTMPKNAKPETSHTPGYEGIWRISYNTGAQRIYVIASDGQVAFVVSNTEIRGGILRKQETGHVIDFGTEIETIDHADGKLSIAHSNLTTNSTTVGTGIRIDPLKPTIHSDGSFKAFQGLWTVRYSNTATRLYLISDNGSVVFVGPDGCKQGEIARNASELVLELKGNTLERIRLSSTMFHVDHYNPRTNYPDKEVNCRGLGQRFSAGAAPWNELDISQAKSMDGFLRIDATARPPVFGFDPTMRLSTKQLFSGPIEVSAIARTAKENIRLDGPNGAVVIFNWELDNKKLAVHRPDGIPFKMGSIRPIAAKRALLQVLRPDGTANKLGSAVYVPFEPLIPDKWYSLKWILSEKEVRVLVNEKVVFSETRQYKLDLPQPVGISAMRSMIDVKAFKVERLPTGGVFKVGS